MNSVLDFKIRKLTLDERVSLEKKFNEEILIDRDRSEELWLELHNFFSQNEYTYDYVYRHDFFRWYTDLTWQRLNFLNENDFLQIAIKRQILDALLLDYDVWQQIIWYFISNNHFDEYDVDSLKGIYRKIKSIISESQIIVGMDGAKEIKVRDVYKDLQIINQKKNDSLLLVEKRSVLSKIIISRQKEDDVFFNSLDLQNEVVNNFISLLSFFIGVSEKNIFALVYTFLHQNTGEVVDDEDEQVEASPQVVEDTSLDKKEVQVEAVEKELVVKNKKEDKVVNFVEIKKMASQKFPSDSVGEILDIEGLLGFLNEMANKYGDDRIEELYYFDENTGKFKWNKDLLS